MKTELNTRTLWFDGTSQVAPEDVPSLLLGGCKIDELVVSELNDDLRLFNLLEEEPILTEKNENKPFDFTYLIAKEYDRFDLEGYIRKKVSEKFADEPAYLARVEAEMIEIKKRGMEKLYITLIYIVDKFKELGTVWGVGRGSSCASLILFLIDLHKVDPIKYNIPMTEFFHD